jgi:hypothetical protein
MRQRWKQWKNYINEIKRKEIELKIENQEEYEIKGEEIKEDV